MAGRGVLNEGRNRAEVDGREPIHVLPLNFAVDATDHVIDPRGLFCTTLNARLHIIDTAATALRTMESCINRCDLEIEDLVSAPLAAGLSSLVLEERELGATIIDMGGGTTSMAVYADKQMMHTAYLPIGGLHVTKDLAIGLSTTLIHAERLKTLFGNVESSPDDDRELLPVPLVGEEDHQLAKVPRSMVVNIIRPRIEETFEYIKDRLDSSGMGRAAGNRVVLTGGACQLPGVREMAARMLGRQVRLGRPAALRGLPELASGPAFSTAAGLLSWAAGDGRGFQDINLDGEPTVGLFRRFVNFLKERV
jgi:cell division protein FtsA